MLAEIIPKIAAAEQFEKGKRDRRYRPRASASGLERCLRADVYHGLDVPREPFPGRAMLIFDDATWQEELTADWIRKSAFKLHSEQMELTVFEVNGKPVYGHIDGIITDPAGIDRLWEHKAINMFTFGKYELGEIPRDYIYQCCSYINGLRKEAPGINEAILLIKNKNTAQYMEFLIKYDFDKDSAEIILTVADGKVKNDKLAVMENIIKSAIERFETIQKYIDGKKLPLRPYDIDHWRCLAKNTMVRTINGWKKIQNITICDKVLSANGQFNEVLNIRKSNSNKKCFQIKAFNLLPITVTEDHKILVEEAIGDGNAKGEIKWMEAGEIFNFYKNKKLKKNHKKIRLLYRINTYENILSNLDIHKINLLGLFIAEGSLSNKQKGQEYRVDFCFNIKERNLVERIRNAVRKHFNNANVTQKIIHDYRHEKERKYLKVAVHSVDLVKWLKKYINIGKAYQKYFKENITQLPINYLRQLLEVMIIGDGCYLKTRNSPTKVYSTTSRKLALQVQEIFLRLNKIAGITRQKPNDKTLGYRDIYHVRCYYEADFNYGFIENNIFHAPIARIEQVPYLDKVYDISVKDMPNFLTEGGIVHNCSYCGWGQYCYKDYEKEFEKLKVTKEVEEDVRTEVGYYLEVSMHRKEIEKEAKTMKAEEDKMKNKVLNMLKEKEIKKAQVGEYILERKLTETSRLNKKALPIDLIIKATETAKSEKFTIRKITAKEIRGGLEGSITPIKKVIQPTKTKKKITWKKIKP